MCLLPSGASYAVQSSVRRVYVPNPNKGQSYYRFAEVQRPTLLLMGSSVSPAPEETACQRQLTLLPLKENMMLAWEA